jgi:uroporphyrinogen-III synthase
MLPVLTGVLNLCGGRDAFHFPRPTRNSVRYVVAYARAFGREIVDRLVNTRAHLLVAIGRAVAHLFRRFGHTPAKLRARSRREQNCQACPHERPRQQSDQETVVVSILCV